MTIKTLIEDEDIVKGIQLTISPVEYLVLSQALMEYAESPIHHTADIRIANSMREEIIKQGENT